MLSFNKINLPIPMSLYCQRQIKDYYNINTQYIPHATNTELFHPLSNEERNKLKAKLGLTDKFIVGVVGRNQGRKMMDRIFKTFKQFSLKAKNAVLLLHTDPMDIAGTFEMNKIIETYSLQNRVFFTGMTFYKGFIYEQMNNVYNTFDVYFSTSSGEGFGVCTIEAMSCGIPCVLPDYTTTHELIIKDGQCGEAFLLAGNDEDTHVETMLNQGCTEKEMDLRLSNGTITGAWTVERGISCIYDGALKLEKLYKDASLREQYGKIGREKVLKYYSWQLIIDEWDRRLTKLVIE
jgi:glycosyltransferase involved in cell wall biosynthesis